MLLVLSCHVNLFTVSNWPFQMPQMSIIIFSLQAACCFGSAACSLCCACCPSCKNSTATRIAYALILLLGTIVACIMLAPGLESALTKVCSSPQMSAHLPWYHVIWLIVCPLQIPGLCSGIGFGPVGTDPLLECHLIVGYRAVYRVCFALAAFFFLFALIMINVKSSNDPRSKIQNGWETTQINGFLACFYLCFHFLA